MTESIIPSYHKENLKIPVNVCIVCLLTFTTDHFRTVLHWLKNREEEKDQMTLRTYVAEVIMFLQHPSPFTVSQHYL